MHDKHPTDSANSRLDHAVESAEQAIASTRRLAAEAIDGLAHSVDDLRSQAQPPLTRAARYANARAHEGLDAVMDSTHRLADKARHAGDGTVRYIQQEPIKAVLVAAASGAALMALLGLFSGRHGRRD